MSHAKRFAVLPAATLVFGSFLSSTPAQAVCEPTGVPFYGVTVGAIDGYWNTVSSGITTITLDDPTGHIHVYDANCQTLCSIVDSCTVTYTGTLSIWVHGATGPYVLTSSTGLPNVTPLPGPSGCNLVNTAGVCVNIANDSVIQRATVYNVETGTSGTHTVVGSVQQWRFPLPTGGSVVLPCVVLTANGLGNGGCSVAGGAYVGTVATLVDEDVPQPSAGFGTTPLLSVGICEARVTATAAGFGVEEVPLVSVC